jgi:hypothetical protein
VSRWLAFVAESMYVVAMTCLPGQTVGNLAVLAVALVGSTSDDSLRSINPWALICGWAQLASAASST